MATPAGGGAAPFCVPTGGWSVPGQHVPVTPYTVPPVPGGTFAAAGGWVSQETDRTARCAASSVVSPSGGGWGTAPGNGKSGWGTNLSNSTTSSEPLPGVDAPVSPPPLARPAGWAGYAQTAVTSPGPGVSQPTSVAQGLPGWGQIASGSASVTNSHPTTPSATYPTTSGWSVSPVSAWNVDTVAHASPAHSPVPQTGWGAWSVSAAPTGSPSAFCSPTPLPSPAVNVAPLATLGTDTVLSAILQAVPGNQGFHLGTTSEGAPTRPPLELPPSFADSVPPRGNATSPTTSTLHRPAAPGASSPYASPARVATYNPASPYISPEQSMPPVSHTQAGYNNSGQQGGYSGYVSSPGTGYPLPPPNFGITGVVPTTPFSPNGHGVNDGAAEHMHKPFFMQFHSGASFNSLIQILQHETVMTVTFNLTPTHIYISEKANNGSIHNITIDTSHLMNYAYNLRGSNGALLEQHTITCQVKEFAGKLKSATSNTWLMLWMDRPGQTLQIQTKPNPNAKNSRSKKIIEASPVQHLVTNINAFKWLVPPIEYPNEPDVMVKVSVFAAVCNQAKTWERVQLVVEGTNLLIYGLDPLGGKMSTSSLPLNPVYINRGNSGDGQTNFPSPYNAIWAALTFRNLAKISTMADPGGMVAIRFSGRYAPDVLASLPPGIPVPPRIDFPFDNYGYYTCFLK